MGYTLKKFKKFASLLLALVMVCAMSVTAFATSTSTDDAGNGSITISNATVGETYTIYQMATVTYNTATEAYVYTATSAWKSFFSQTEVAAYITYDSTTGIITWNGEKTAERTSAFATLALTYADTLASNQGTTEATSNTVSFSSLSLGWYLVDSSLGTVCSITTTNPSVSILDKNQEAGSLTKTVNGETSAQVGDVLSYKITASVPAYDGETAVTSYTFTDVLDTSLTYNNDIVVEILNASSEVIATTDITSTVYNSYITVDTSVSNSISVSYNPQNITNYPADATIKITYTATLNSAAECVNSNKVTSSFDSTGVTVDVYSFGIQATKVDGNDSTAVLKGAEFVLYYTDSSNINHYATVNNSGQITGWTTTESEASTLTSNSAGQISAFGLEAGTYYLEETKAPDGYNLLSAPVVIVITSTEADNTVTFSATVDNVVATISNDGVVSFNVENNAGSVLPSTGGIGTTIFYVVGTIMVLGAVVVLITRKRMSAE